MKPSLKRYKLCKDISYYTLNIYFGYLLDDSNKYPKRMFNEKIRTKQGISYISICSLSILYNSKFILMATSLETNAVV